MKNDEIKDELTELCACVRRGSSLNEQQTYMLRALVIVAKQYLQNDPAFGDLLRDELPANAPKGTDFII